MGRLNKIPIGIPEEDFHAQIIQYEKLLNKEEKKRLLRDLPNNFNWADKLDKPM